MLSTEKRAHRRAAHGSVSSVPSPPSSEYSRSPLSRFASYSSTSHAVATMANPATPAKHARRTSSIVDSPFSDYFSDDARSAIFNTSAPDEIKQLLLRMNRLQSLIMRDQCRDAIALVGRKLTEIELELNTMHSDTRLDIEDSAVFMDQGYVKEVSAPSSPSRKPANRASPDKSVSAPQGCMECGGSGGGGMDRSTIISADHFRAERDYLNLRMQELVEGLGSAQSELSNRYSEVRELNECHNAAIEEREEQLEQLRSENEGLRSDLGFEYSELLFLKLQMKSMEVDVDEMAEPDIADATTIEDVKATRARIEKKNRILSEMDRWRADWQDVNSRFKRRRNKYGEPLASPLVEAETGEVEWQLETVKEGSRGRVTSLTITRFDSSPNSLDGMMLAESPDAVGDSQIQVEGATRVDAPMESLSSLTAGEDGICISGDQDLERLDPEDEDEDDCSTVATSDEGEEEDDPRFQDLEKEEEDEEEQEEQTAPKHGTVQPTPHVSAWRELWASLASLSGLPDDDDQEGSYEE